MPLSNAQVQQFRIDGYLVIPDLISKKDISALRAITQSHLDSRIEPFELEADVQYPGAPSSRSARGGNTIRRLGQAYARHKQLTQLANTPMIVKGVQQILSCQELFLNPNHHNCVMTKQPEYSSETLWHRDTRYWNFNNKYLVNAWVALGDEQLTNGAMKVLPGSHRWEVQDDALDEAQFLKLDHPDNQDRLETERVVCLNSGDVLLFSAHCFHAAGKNQTSSAKYSAVFTYHGEATQALNNTHSSSRPSIKLI